MWLFSDCVELRTLSLNERCYGSLNNTLFHNDFLNKCVSSAVLRTGYTVVAQIDLISAFIDLGLVGKSNQR